MAIMKKRGAYGTLYQYRIQYTAADDPGCPMFATRVWAYDREHALERFCGPSDDDGWRVVSVSLVAA